MKIYYDENMPFAKEFFSEFGQLVAFSGREVSSVDLADADVLLVRSVTQVNQQLLANNSQLQFVGTATIGVDHIDQAYLDNRNIPFYSAPGCNAVSVAEYVISSLVIMAERYLLDIFSLTVGIVGAGNTGSKLSEKLTALGIKHLLCDPPLVKKYRENGQAVPSNFVSMEQVLACDVISLHVPLVYDGEFPTYHLLNEKNLAQLSARQILINVCRGEIIDNQALLTLKQQAWPTTLVLDVWEKEPDILLPLIDFADIATAHIAGYSVEGKARGSEMLYQALCKQLNRPVKKQLSHFLPVALIDHVNIAADFDAIMLNQLVKLVYDVRRDDAVFRQNITRQGFDYIRKNYPARREFSAVTTTFTHSAKSDVPHRLGFSHLK